MLDTHGPSSWGKVSNCWADLVMCRCLNGDIVWTLPQHRASVESSPEAILHIMSDDGGYNEQYWKRFTKPCD